MSFLRHLSIALVYAAAAVAVALTLPTVVPGVGRWTAIALGALVLVFGALIHEVYGRSERARTLTAALRFSDVERRRIEAELIRAREELRAIQERLLEAPTGEDAARAAEAEADLATRLVRKLQPADDETEILDLTRPLPSDWPPLRAERLAVEPAPEPAPAERMRDPRPPAPERPTDTGAIAALIREAIRFDQLQIVATPIVTLPQRQPALFDCFSRIRLADGGYLYPGDHAAIVADVGFHATIDNLVLFRCVQEIRQRHRARQAAGFFVRVSPYTLRDGDFIREFAEFILDNPVVARHLVLEVSLDDLAELLGTSAAVHRRLVALGTRFAIDAVGTITNIDPILLRKGRIRFIKIPSGRLTELARDPFSGLDMETVRVRMNRAHTDLIVSQVNDEAAVKELLELGVDYGAGPLFGDPRPL